MFSVKFICRCSLHFSISKEYFVCLSRLSAEAVLLSSSGHLNDLVSHPLDDVNDDDY
jgi:hypothetical protein